MDAISKLEAIEGIKLCKARYFRGVDFKDREILRSIFSDDVEIDFRGAATDPISGFNIAPDATNDLLCGGEHAADLVSVALIGVVSVHHASVPEIEVITPTTGRGVWPMVDRLRFVEGSPFREMIGYGHYHDTYEHDGDHWRIKTMRLTRTRIDIVNW